MCQGEQFGIGISCRAVNSKHFPERSQTASTCKLFSWPQRNHVYRTPFFDNAAAYPSRWVGHFLCKVGNVTLPIEQVLILDSFMEWLHHVYSFISALLCIRFGLTGPSHQNCASFLSAKDLLKWYVEVAVERGRVSLHCLWSQPGLGKGRQTAASTQSKPSHVTNLGRQRP